MNTDDLLLAARACLCLALNELHKEDRAEGSPIDEAHAAAIKELALEVRAATEARTDVTERFRELVAKKITLNYPHRRPYSPLDEAIARALACIREARTLYKNST